MNSDKCRDCVSFLPIKSSHGYEGFCRKGPHEHKPGDVVVSFGYCCKEFRCSYFRPPTKLTAYEIEMANNTLRSACKPM